MLNLIQRNLHAWAGAIASRLGDSRTAVKLLAAAINYGDRSPATEESLADNYLELGDDVRAAPLLVSAYERSGKPGRIALKLAKVYQRSGDLERAESVLAQAAARSWTSAAALELAIVRLGRGKLSDAEQSLREILAREPRTEIANILLGKVFMRGNRPREALACFESALGADPANAEKLCCAGEALAALGETGRADEYFRRALEEDPGFVPAALDLGLLMSLNGRLPDAARWYARATQIAPENAVAWRQLGTMQLRVGELSECMPNLERALSLSPHDPEVLNSIGMAHAHGGRFSVAEGYFERALALAPDLHQARLNRALALLTRGQYEAGFADYESRLNTPNVRDVLADSPWPLWNGEPVSGRRVVIRSEQGFGDSIQMIRLAGVLAAKGATVLVETSPPLQRLLAKADGVRACGVLRNPKRDADYLCPMMSLPRKLAINLATLPAAVPYIHLDPADRSRWNDRLEADSGVRIGLAWSSDPDNWISFAKSVPLAELAGAALVDGARLFNLQVGHGASEIKALPASIEMQDRTPEIHDFYDTACLVSNLDLVITIDTAVAHLAGSLGKPVWILLHHAPDWRWLLERSDSPWYPTARLFRQRWAGDWKGVLAEVRNELPRFIASLGSSPPRDA